MLSWCHIILDKGVFYVKYDISNNLKTTFLERNRGCHCWFFIFKMLDLLMLCWPSWQPWYTVAVFPVVLLHQLSKMPPPLLLLCNPPTPYAVCSPICYPLSQTTSYFSTSICPITLHPPLLTLHPPVTVLSTFSLCSPFHHNTPLNPYGIQCPAFSSHRTHSLIFVISAGELSLLSGCQCCSSQHHQQNTLLY